MNGNSQIIEPYLATLRQMKPSEKEALIKLLLHAVLYVSGANFSRFQL